MLHEPHRQSLTPRWFFAFFFVSGACSLVYEVVWLRLAMATYGTTTPSISTVLSVFMGGLALGSWLAGRLARGLEGRPGAALRLYAAAEAVIALSGLVVPRLFGLGHRLMLGLTRDTALASGGYYLASGAAVTLSLLPFCTAMGTTFPLGMAAIRGGAPAASARSFSYLYLANVLGAVTGTLLSAFVLVETLGFHGTLLAAAALNVLLALSAAALGSRARPAAPGIPAAAEPPAASPAASRSLLPMLFTTGLVSMAMEVVWVRQYTLYLGTVVYTFATILALYLGSMAAGSALYRRGAGAGRLPTGVAWIGAGTLSLLPLMAADPRLPLQGGGGGLIRLALGIAPFCASMGFLTPMLVDRWSGGHPGLAGRAYAVNVVGCILGPLLAGFALLPGLGERGSLVALAVPLFALALPDLASARGAGCARIPLRAALYGAAAVLLVAWGRDYASFMKGEVRRDYEATVVATGEGMRRFLLVNGIGITHLTPIAKMMAHLPAAFADPPPRRALVICFGMGTSFRSALSWGIPTTAVELVPSVPSLFGYFHADGPALLASPQARMVVDDGRRFLERTQERYDVITIDPPPPVEAAGSSLLYSREFYRLARSHLSPGGVLQQWLPTAERRIGISVTRALVEEFPHVRVFASAEGWGHHFLASERPLPPLDAAQLASRLPARAQADLLEWWPGLTAAQAFQKVLARELDPAAILSWNPRVPALRDDRPYNEYYFLRRVVGRGD